MSLSQRIASDLQKALKRSDKLTLSVLRLAKAALTNREKESGEELSEDDVIAVLSTLTKQRRESIEQFSHGGREDLAEKERQELDILLSYMPKQLSTHELDTLVAEAIHETSADGLKDLGKVMKILMPRIKGAADGKIVNQRVKELLASQRDWKIFSEKQYILAYNLTREIKRYSPLSFKKQKITVP